MYINIFVRTHKETLDTLNKIRNLGGSEFDVKLCITYLVSGKVKVDLRLMETKRIVYEDKKKQQVAAEWFLAWIVSNGSLLRADLTDEYTSWWNSPTTPLDTGISDVLLGVIRTQFKLSIPVKTVSNYPWLMMGWKSLFNQLAGLGCLFRLLQIDKYI